MLIPTTVTRRFQFCAGHRLVDHEGKCAHLHGHNYVAFITCGAANLDDCGRVIDFSVIKEQVGRFIDRAWDHKMILNSEDQSAVQACQYLEDPVYVMNCNPTAENMARELGQVADELLEPYGVRVTQVELWETENCHATCDFEDYRSEPDE